MKFIPHDYQRFCIEYIKTHPISALFLDMGLGKTVITLTAIRDLMLSALLGPQAGFLSMVVILAIQCLFFADGGLLALGANCWNMAFYGCFVGYYLLWKPIMRSKLFGSSKGAARAKITLASILGCIITLQLGAFSVVRESRPRRTPASPSRGCSDPSRSPRRSSYGPGRRPT